MKFKIKQLKVSTIIGTLDHERTTKQDIFIDIEFEYDASKPACSDNLFEAVDYSAITEKVLNFVKASQFYLLEKLVSEVLKLIASYEQIFTARVSISKPNAIAQANTIIVSDEFLRA